MLSLRILTTLKNLKVGDLMIPVLNPLCTIDPGHVQDPTAYISLDFVENQTSFMKQKRKNEREKKTIALFSRNLAVKEKCRQASLTFVLQQK